MRVLLPLLVLCVAASGCARLRIHRGPETVPAGAVVEHKQKFAVLGLYRIGAPLDISSDCPAGWRELAEESGTFDTVMHIATLGMYVPWSVTAICAVPAPAPAQTPR